MNARSASAAVTAIAPWRDQLRHALAGLGFTGKEVADAIEVVARKPMRLTLTSRPHCAAASSFSDARVERATGSPATARETDPRAADAEVSGDARRRRSRVEASLRPKRLTEFPGQPKVREQLQLVLESAAPRGDRPPDHVLLSGPPGLGKTSLAMIIAAELGTPIRVTSGPAIERAGDLAALLTSLSEGEVLFIDEIHRIARPAEELLYMAMEDFRVDVIVGKGPGATAIPLELAPFTLVGATTRAGLLTGPLRDRFGFTGHMDFYDRRRAGAGAAPLGGPARGASAPGRRRRDRRPLARHAAHRQPAAAPGPGLRRGPRGRRRHRGGSPRAALAVYDVDELGLDRLDRAVLDALVRRFGGGPVGSRTLAVAVGEEVETSRRSPSRSSSAPACWPEPRAGGSRRRPPGSIWACPPLARPGRGHPVRCMRARLVRPVR